MEGNDCQIVSENQHEDVHMDEEMRSGVGGSRWNPTKEQIEMLERMYSEGTRTPTAEQIQQITARLRVYGHIEGKNVFYWFQNHKARQRQKQRQERLVSASASTNHHINRFIGHPPLLINQPYHPNINNNHSINSINGVNASISPRPIFPAPPPPHGYLPHHPYLPNPNVICSSYYKLPQANMSYYPQHPPQHYYNAPPTDNHYDLMKRWPSKSSGYSAAMMKDYNYKQQNVEDMNCMGSRTLNLFPVYPTGILEHKLRSNNNSTANSSAASSSSDTNGDEQPQRLFDFFSIGHASSESV